MSTRRLTRALQRFSRKLTHHTAAISFVAHHNFVRSTGASRDARDGGGHHGPRVVHRRACGARALLMPARTPRPGQEAAHDARGRPRRDARAQCAPLPERSRLLRLVGEQRRARASRPAHPNLILTGRADPDLGGHRAQRVDEELSGCLTYPHGSEGATASASRDTVTV